MKQYLTEFIGTFFLVFTISLTVTQGVAVAPLAIGAVLMVMVYMGGHISGAHYNPAITLALSIRGAAKWGDLVPYVIAQVVGAMAAAAVANVILGGAPFAPAPGKMASGEVYSPASVLLTEALFTFGLALVIMNVATSKKTEGNSYYGLAIGFTIVAAAFAGGGISGGAYNPAVGLGPILHDTIRGGSSIGHVWYYVVGPCVGAVIAVFVFKLQEGDGGGDA